MKSSEVDRRKPIAWEEAPARELARLSWPIAISLVSYATMTLVDTIFVGRLGPAALAGVGLGGTATFALICFPLGLMRGAKVLVSQARGAGDLHATGAYLGAALVFCAGFTVLAMGAVLGVGPLLVALSATPEAGAFAKTYLTMRMLAAPAMLAFIAVREVRYGLGDSHWPMVASVSANILNIALAYLLIFPAGLGVTGAGLATAVAQTVEALVLLAVQTKDGWRVRGMRPVHLWAMWRIGLPSAIQFLLEMGSFAVLASLLAHMSELAIAAHVIALQIIHFSFLPALAMGEGVSVMVGEAVGARRDELVPRLARSAAKVACGYMGLCGLAMFVWRHELALGFTDDPPLVALTARLFIVAAVFQVFDAANMIGRSVLRGAGDVRFPAVVGIVVAWLSTPPLTWLFGYVAGLGAVGGWIGLCVELVVGGVIFWYRLERGGWRAAAAKTRAEREAVELGQRTASAGRAA